jgi:hypothetical protein
VGKTDQGRPEKNSKGARLAAHPGLLELLPWKVLVAFLMACVSSLRCANFKVFKRTAELLYLEHIPYSKARSISDVTQFFK